MHEEILKTLTLLRKYIYQREWGLMQSLTRDLLAQLPMFDALQVVLDALQAYLPIFERHHPQGTVKGQMPRELMLTVLSFGFAPEQLPEYIAGEYDTPGSGQFANAVLEMCRAMQKDRDPAQRADLFASAIANVILAELSELYYTAHPDDYARVRANHIDPMTGNYTDPDAAKIPWKLWADPLVEARDVTLWLRIADALENKHNTQAAGA